MNRKIIAALIENDVSLHFRDFVSLLNFAGLFVFIILYFFLPSSVNESFEIGLYSPKGAQLLPAEIPNAGLEIRTVASEEELKQAILKKELLIGITLPQALDADIAPGPKPEIKVFFSTNFPGEFKDSLIDIFRELVYMRVGRMLPVRPVPIVLGPDMLGKQIPLRKRLLPLFGVVILIMEILGLASLMTYELENKTIFALLVTPVRMVDIFTAKVITGTGLAFAQVVLFMAVTGGLAGGQALLVVLTLFLGALMVTGLAFLIASVARDFMSVMAWGFIAIFVLVIPPFAVLLPGISSGWIHIFPSYYMVDTVNRAVNYNAGWEQWYHLPILLAFDALFLMLGIKAIRRRMT